MRKYSTYKDSGVEWIGEIPENWMMKKPTYVFRQIGSGTTPPSNDESFYEGNIHWLQTGDLTDGIITDTNKKVTQKAIEQFSTLKIYPKGSLVIAMYGATIGKVGLLNIDTCTNQACCVLAYPNSTLVNFVYYWFISAKQSIILMGYGGGQPNISQETIKSLRLPIPPLPEQQTIVTYLDEKTALIDELIRKKEEKIQLLKEIRTALINHVVTKGLDDEVEMKDSGVEWLDEIPLHWSLKSIRHIGNLQNGISKGAEYFGSGYPFVTYGDVYNNEVLPLCGSGLAKSTSEDQELYSILEGDILFTRTSESKDDIGVSSYCEKTIPHSTFSGFLIRFRNESKSVLGVFLKYYFNSYFKKVFIESQMNIVTRSSLSQEVLKRVPVLIPPIHEQQQIVTYLDEQTQLIDTTVQREEQKIELLKEYRQSLISNVVTGKVCVLND